MAKTVLTGAKTISNSCHGGDYHLPLRFLFYGIVTFGIEGILTVI